VQEDRHTCSEAVSFILTRQNYAALEVDMDRSILLFNNPSKSDVKHPFFDRSFVLVARKASFEAGICMAPVLQCSLAHLQEYDLLVWGVPVVEGRFRECMVNILAGFSYRRTRSNNKNAFWGCIYADL
jgi:hypothetical protein